MGSHALLLAQTAEPNLCFLACSPEGPGIPFGNPVIAALDVLRILCMIAGLVVIVLTPRIVLHSVGHWGQAARFAGTALFCLVAIDTRLEHFGDYASVRLMLDMAATILACAGIWSFYYREGGARYGARNRGAA